VESVVKQVRESSVVYGDYAPQVLERYVRESVMPYIRALGPQHRSGGRAKGELVVASEVIDYFAYLEDDFVLGRREEEEFAQLDKLSAEMGYEVGQLSWMHAAQPSKKGKKGKKARRVTWK
jgi:hypothetical protein